MASATLVWRRSWKRHDTPAARWALRKWWVWKLECDSGWPAPFGNTSASGSGRRRSGRGGRRSIAATAAEIVIVRTPAVGLRWPADPRAVVELDELLDRPAPCGGRRRRSRAAGRRARSSACRCRRRGRSASGSARSGPRRAPSPAPSEHRHLASSGTFGGRTRSHGLVSEPVLLDGGLQHPPQGPVVAVDRRRRQALAELVVEPVLDLLGRQPAEPDGAEAREDVPVEVAPVGLLRRRRQRPGEASGTSRPTARAATSAPRGSIQWPRSLSTSTSRANRSASALRRNVRLRCCPSGSR